MSMTGGTAVLVHSGQPSGWPDAIRLYVYYKIKSQSAANNTTTLSLGLYVTTPTGWDIGPWTDYGSYLGVTPGGVTVDGYVPNFQGTRYLAENREFTVSHNADGTKTATVYWKWGVSSTWGGFVAPSGTVSVTLPAIARESTVSGAKTVLGKTCTLRIKKAAESAVSRLSWSFGGLSGSLGDTSADTFDWQTQLAWASQLPGAVSGEATVTVQTLVGGTVIGSRSCTVTLTVPASVKPTVESLTAERIDGTVPAAWGVYVQGKSKARLTASGISGAYGSAIRSCVISGGGFSSSAATLQTGILNQSGYVSFTCTVTDSRGRTAEKTQRIYLQPYSSPVLSGVRLYRCNAQGTAADNGAYLYGRADAAMSSVGGHNAMKLTLTLATQAGAPLASAALTPGGSAITGGTMAGSTAYKAILTAEDSLGGTDTVTAVIPSAHITFMLKAGGNGAAFGEYPTEDNAVSVTEDWLFKAKGGLQFPHNGSLVSPAPSGYGLGGGVTYEYPDANNANKSGFYACSTNTPTSGWYDVFVIRHDDNNITQTAYHTSNGCAAVRQKVAGTWQPWEWVNPPMSVGTEYRTTRRFGGKPVYCKAINLGTVPAQNASKTTAHGVSGMSSPLHWCGYVSDGTSIPCSHDINTRIDGHFNRTNFVLYNTSRLTNVTVYVIIYYTKS